ncbi:MAG: WecB/TagA/CpsF family glycosyltransferase [Dehalococcoidia bacterium]|nr:WecB/TagA/CpsF family glycosyltransferase [Dehalococcoidia bacterium]
MRFEDAVQLLIDAPRQARRLRVHFAAVHTLVEASKDAELRDALAGADVVAPDGMPLVWLGRLKGKRPQRVCGPDTMPAVLDRSRDYGYRHFFYGGTPELASELVESLTLRFPGLEVAGVYSPPFRPLTFDEVDDVARMINDADPDYVWVGLGSPKQDYWLAAFRPLLHAPVLLAVGAAFDFQAGRVKRAPRWAQRLGLEWAFRLAAEPRRLAGRYTLMSLRFLQLLLADAARRRQVTP